MRISRLETKISRFINIDKRTAYKFNENISRYRLSYLY